VAGGTVGAESREDLPRGKRSELAQGADPEPEEKVYELSPLEDLDRPR
jgi:hypothetical protein